MPVDIARMRALRQAVEAALDDPARLEVPGAINHADLSCIDVLWVVSENGDAWWQVVLSEVSPEAFDLEKYVEQRLVGDFGHVEVLMCW